MAVNINLLTDWKVERNNKSLLLSYNAPENATGWYPIGFERGNDKTFDAMGWFGLIIVIKTDKDETKITIEANIWENESIKTEAYICGAGTHEIKIRLNNFDIENCKKNIWRFLESFKISGDGEIISAWLRRGDKIYTDAYIKGKSGEINDEITYHATVYNCTDQPQAVETKQEFLGWESLIADIAPKSFILPVNGSQEVKISVKLHDYMPPGSHENTVIKFIPNGDGSAEESIMFKSLRKLAHPYIYHNKQGWDEVRNKIDKYDKFKQGYNAIINDAGKWEVSPPNNERDYLYDTREEHYIMSAGFAYAITGEKKYAEKLAKFYRYFIDEETGYPKKKKGCSQSYVQEGHFFQHLAIPYDIIHDSGVLTEDDHKGIEKCFRIYMDILDKHLQSGHISNWLISEITGAFYCALAVEDIHMALRFAFGPGGSIEHLKKGLFNDGWWYECSISYNTWVSSMFLHLAHSLLPFGYNILHTHFQIPFNKQVSGSYMDKGQKVRFGMYNEKWGGNLKNYVCIKDMFDATIPFLDYRGVIFGMCDSTEKKLEGVHFGSTYDLAYKYYKDPAYIKIIEQSSYADPVFGIAEFPAAEAAETYTKNAYSDNIGIAMLRSQTEGRRQREQIQAVLRYGSHGYAHGHFDRTSLLSIMRYGRSFFNPEHVWWGYGHFMYKFYVQNSIAKNMVVVDEKLQVPNNSRRTLFYTGKAIQATAVETCSKWSYPPYGGMVYDLKSDLESRCKLNGCSLPKLDNPPKYGELTNFTEEITQKRIMAVLDDYIILFDYLKGEKEHTYDSLFQIKGFKKLEGENVKLIGHKKQFTENPLSDAQFITDCNCYSAEGTSIARFETVFGENEDMRGTRSFYNEPGLLKMDVYTAWPLKTEQIIGLAAESHGIQIPFKYTVEANGNELANGGFGAWILGEGFIDINVENTNSLTIKIFCDPMYNENQYPYTTKQGLFLGEAYIVTDTGEKKYLYELPLEYENIDAGYGIGKDYEGGRVLIVGAEYEHAIPVSPLNHDYEGKITINLQGLNAAKFIGNIGADAFPGDEDQRRRTYAVRDFCETGRFITVIEAYESCGLIKEVTAVNENEVSVLLADGRKQVVTVLNIEENEPSVILNEFCNGEIVRHEKAK